MEQTDKPTSFIIVATAFPLLGPAEAIKYALDESQRAPVGPATIMIEKGRLTLSASSGRNDQNGLTLEIPVGIKLTFETRQCDLLGETVLHRIVLSAFTEEASAEAAFAEAQRDAAAFNALPFNDRPPNCT